MSSRSRITSVSARPSANGGSTSGGSRSVIQYVSSKSTKMCSPVVVANNRMNSKKSEALVPPKPSTAPTSRNKDLKPVSNVSKPLWQSVATFSNRIAPSKANKVKKEEEMVTSTGTESSGIFSDPEDSKPAAEIKALKPAQIPTRKITTAVAKSTSKFVKRATSTSSSSSNDQAVITELRNQIDALKAQHRDQIEQLKHELGEKFRNDMAVLLAEQESQFHKQLEAKEAAWTAELNTRLEEERSESVRRLAERDATLKAIETSRSEERADWQHRLDELTKRADHILADKERLEKTIRQEVDARVQATVQRYNELQKETSSLQAVFELRCQEVKALRLELERASALAAEAPTLRERNLSLANHVEGLEAQLEHKTNEERRLQAELAKLKAHCKDESARIRLLSMEKEQLQYRLQQRNDCDRSSPTKSHHSTPLSSTTETPKMNRKAIQRINLTPIVAETNGKPNGDSVHHSPPTPERDGHSCKTRRSDADSGTSDVDDVFHSTPSLVTDLPSSPAVRDFTKKNDSVSYVLDIGEHSPSTSGGGGGGGGSGSTPGLPPLLMASPWPLRRNHLVRSASLRYPTRHPH